MSVQAVVTDSPNRYPDILEEAWRQHLAPREPDAPTVVSVFAGCGGSSLGYGMAGFRELLAIEWDDGAARTFGLNFPGVPVHRRDVAGLSADQCLETMGLRSGELDVLDGSPPCQGFSTSGKRNLWDPRNGLYNEFARLLERLKPKAFVMENVSGMVKGKMKLAFADCTRKLKGAGYRVSCRMLDAKWFGVPQERKRLVWIGLRKDLLLEPSHPAAERRPFSVAEALEDLLPGDAGQASPFMRKEWIAACRNDLHGNAWRVASLPSPTIVACRPPVVLLDDGRRRGWSADRPSFVIRAGRRPELRFRQGRGLVRTRPLTDRECARLQSFPDQFRFVGTKASVQRQIGNGVPPMMMKAVAAHVRGLLGVAGRKGDS